jgi:hypothetical protein
MALGLPKLRWLLVGAVAAGAWVVYDDMNKPRPPARVVGTQKAQPQRSADTKPRPQLPLAAKSEKRPEPGKTATARPTPPKAVGGKPEAQKTALALPRTIDRPPPKPEKMTTGAITPKAAPAAKPIYVQTTAKVRLRAQARTNADVIATLEPRVAMREVARSGAWRLVVGGGQKGWVHADYLAPASYLARRPKLPVADVKQTAAQ